MTLDEFIEALEKTPRDWVLFQKERIRRQLSKSVACCPISALRQRDAMIWEATAHELGLSEAIAQEIVLAADKSKAYDPTLRLRLLKACALMPGEETSHGK